MKVVFISLIFSQLFFFEIGSELAKVRIGLRSELPLSESDKGPN